MLRNIEVNHSTIDEIGSLWQPDSLLPIQYFETFQRKIETEPEKKLMLAVLEDAVASFQKYFSSRGGRGLRLFRETEEWIFKEKSNRPFSFGNICEVVGLDPQYLRQGLLRWRKMKLTELSKFLEPPPKTKVKRSRDLRRRLEDSFEPEAA